MQVSCQVEDVAEAGALREVEELLEGLNSRQGVLLASSYEFPGRYARWTVGFLDPPLKVESRGLEFTVTALNERGKVLLSVVHDALVGGVGEDGQPPLPLEAMERGETVLRARVPKSEEYFPEEERSRQPSIFSVIRAIVRTFYSEGDPQLGLYGAFGE